MIEDGQQWMMLLRALGSLFLVIALIITLAWVAKKYWRPDKWGMSISGIKVVHHLPLDSKKKLLVIEIDQRQFLVGVGADSVSSIVDLGASSGVEAEVRYVERA